MASNKRKAENTIEHVNFRRRCINGADPLVKLENYLDYLREILDGYESVAADNYYLAEYRHYVSLQIELFHEYVNFSSKWRILHADAV